MQALYLLDYQGEDAMPMIETMLEGNADPGADLPYARLLLRGAWRHRHRFDARIDAVAQHWSPERMPGVDRNIMRIALFELLERNDPPPKVAMNEAVEIAKQFSTRESSRFINGILDAIWKQQQDPTNVDNDTTTQP